ncbi:MAG: glycosyltransferase family 2 protein [Salinimicrobium sp.]
MNIAVIILNWNGKSLLEQFLPSVVKHSKEAQVYVADNASEDDSVAFLRKHYPQVKIIENEVNGGFAKGYNDALKHVEEEVFVLLNSDVEVTPNWLQALITELDNSPETAAVQPKIINWRKKNFFEYAGAAGGFIDRLGYPYCRGRMFETVEKDEGQYDDTVEIFWASGACMMIRKKDFYAAGQFDEDFFAHQEEIDLCWRLYNQDRKVKAVGDSRVFHLGGGTLDSMHPQKTFYNFRNSLYALLKNVPGKQVYFLLLGRLILDGIAGIKFLAEGKAAHFTAILKAHFSFYSHFGLFLKKRKNLPKRRKYSNITSVVLAYYLRRRTKYSDL